MDHECFDIVHQWEVFVRGTFPKVGSLVLSILFPFALSAQAVSGFIADVESEERVQGAEVALVDAAGVTHVAVLSGENGEFYLEAPGPGPYELRVRRIGFKPASAQVILQTNRVLEVRLSLAPQATQLEGITVYGQTAETPEQQEFLSRRHLPWNDSYDRSEIAELRQGLLHHLLAFSIPTVPACRVVYIDGRYSHLDSVGLGVPDTALAWQTEMVYGLEVYRTWFDIPIRYREPAIRGGARPSQRCGAILIWRTTPPGYAVGIPTVWSGALGWGFGWERELIDVGWRRSAPGARTTAVHVRIGRHSPIDLLRSSWSESGPLDPNQYTVYLSLYLGNQGPIPVVPNQQWVYSRVALGGSLYFGQSSTTEPSADTTVIVSAGSPLYVGFGGQVAVGIHYPKGSVRPFVEARSGSEWVLNAGLRWVKPVISVGLEFGGMRHEEPSRSTQSGGA